MQPAARAAEGHGVRGDLRLRDRATDRQPGEPAQRAERPARTGPAEPEPLGVADRLRVVAERVALPVADGDDLQQGRRHPRPRERSEQLAEREPGDERGPDPAGGDDPGGEQPRG